MYASHVNNYMFIEKPVSHEHIVALGVKAGTDYLNSRTEGAFRVEFPENNSGKAQMPSFPFENQLSGAIYRSVKNVDPESYSNILNQILIWAEDNGWQRKDEVVDGTGVATLRKNYQDPGNEAVAE